MSDRNSSRREFLKTTGVVTAGLVAGSLAAGANASATTFEPHNPRTNDAMPTRNLGKTGYRVGIFSLGGQAAIEHPDNADVAVPLVERAIDLGVNYIDT